MKLDLDARGTRDEQESHEETPSKLTTVPLDLSSKGKLHSPDEEETQEDLEKILDNYLKPIDNTSWWISSRFKAQAKQSEKGLLLLVL